MDWIKGTKEQERDNIIDMLFAKKTIRYEIADFLLGKYLGNGISRYVFENNLNNKTVIKIEVGDQRQNAIEKETWSHVQYVKHISKWFAPCYELSECNRILIQAKCISFEHPSKFKMPNKIPVFFTDIKMDNWGFYKGNPVCMDYGNILLFEHGMSRKLKAIKW